MIHPEYEEYKSDGTEGDINSFVRTVSIARPSIRSDILTEDDSIQGTLHKQSPSFLKPWQKRYFILEKKMLRYFKNEHDYKSNKPPKGVLNFQQIWIEPNFIDL
jgi:hypothetical protein